MLVLQVQSARAERDAEVKGMAGRLEAGLSACTRRWGAAALPPHFILGRQFAETPTLA